MWSALGWLFACNSSSGPSVRFAAAPAEILAGANTAVQVVVSDDEPELDVITYQGSVDASGPVRTGTDGAMTVEVAPSLPGAYALVVVATDPGGRSGSAEWRFEAVDGDADGDGAIAESWGGPDCDDSDPDVVPGASEQCDGVDDDCDGLIDEEPTDGVPMWPDLDGDGFGDLSAESGLGCPGADGLAAQSGDCRDGDAFVFPWHVQVGSAGCEGFGLASVWRGEVLDDAAGDRGESAGDVDGDGRAEVGISAPQAQAGAGTVYVVDADAPGVASLALAGRALIGRSRGDTLGYELTSAGDWDGDGLSDLAIGAPGVDARIAGEGAIYIVSAPPLGRNGVADVARHIVYGIQPNDGLGTVAFAGDTDGNGVPELLVGAPVSDLGGGGNGYVAILQDLPLGEANLIDVAASLLIGEPDAGAGDPARGADLDGDGLMDVLVGAQQDTTNGEESGAVYVVRGPMPSGSWTLDQADSKLLGPAGAIVGHSLDAAGDVDGDGRADVVIGGPYADEKTGLVYVVRAPAAIGVVNLAMVAHAVIGGESAGDRAGFSVAGIGDVNGDGVPDLAVGAKFEDTVGIDAGAVYLVDGDVAGQVVLGDAEMKLLGEAEGDTFGDVGSTGDVDGDGLVDFVVGARKHAEDKIETGAAYVVFGAAF